VPHSIQKSNEQKVAAKLKTLPRRLVPAKAASRCAYHRSPRRAGKNWLVARAGGVTVEPAMKTLSGKEKISGFTLIELLVLICLIAGVIALKVQAYSVVYSNVMHLTPYDYVRNS